MEMEGVDGRHLYSLPFPEEEEYSKGRGYEKGEVYHAASLMLLMIIPV